MDGQKPSAEKLPELPSTPSKCGMIPLQALVRHALRLISGHLAELLDSHLVSSSERKVKVLDFIKHSRILTLKIIAISRWSRTCSDPIIIVHKLISVLHGVDSLFDASVAVLNDIKNMLANARVNNYDVVTSLDLLSTGSFLGFPTIVSEYLVHDTLSDSATLQVLEKLDQIIRMRLVTCECGVPLELTQKFVIGGGKVVFTVATEFEITLTLPGGPDPFSPWHILDLKILDSRLALHPYQRLNLMQLGQQKLHQSVLNFPLLELYHFYHYFVLRLRMERLILESLGLSAEYKTQILNSRNVLEIKYWLKPVEASFKVVMESKQKQSTINATFLPSVNRPPAPSMTPVRVVPPRQVHTVEYKYKASHLVVVYDDKTMPIQDQTIEQILETCLSHKMQQMLEKIVNIIPNHQAYIDEDGNSVIIPSRNISISVQKQTGRFFVSPMTDLHYSKTQDLQEAINQDLNSLPELLAKLDAWMRQDQIEAHCIFQGFKPTEHKIYQSARVLKHVQELEYLMVIEPEKCTEKYNVQVYLERDLKLVGKFEATRDDIYPQFKHIVALEEIRINLAEYGIRGVMRPSGKIGIIPDFAAPGDGLLMNLKYAVIEVDQAKIQVQIRLRQPISEREMERKRFDEARKAIEWINSTFLVLKATSFIMPETLDQMSINLQESEITIVSDACKMFMRAGTQGMRVLDDDLSAEIANQILTKIGIKYTGLEFAETLKAIEFWWQMQSIYLTVKSPTIGQVNISQNTRLFIRIHVKYNAVELKTCNYLGFDRIIQDLAAEYPSKVLILGDTRAILSLDLKAEVGKRYKAELMQNLQMYRAHAILMPAMDNVSMEYENSLRISSDWSEYGIRLLCGAEQAIQVIEVNADCVSSAVTRMMRRIQIGKMDTMEAVAMAMLELKKVPRAEFVLVAKALGKSSRVRLELAATVELNSLAVRYDAKTRVIEFVMSFEDGKSRTVVPVRYSFEDDQVRIWGDEARQEEDMNPSTILARLASKSHKSVVSRIIRALELEGRDTVTRLERLVQEIDAI